MGLLATAPTPAGATRPYTEWMDGVTVGSRPGTAQHCADVWDERPYAWFVSYAKRSDGTSWGAVPVPGTSERLRLRSARVEEGDRVGGRALRREVGEDLTDDRHELETVAGETEGHRGLRILRVQ